MRNCQMCEQPIFDLNRKKFCSDKCMLENRNKLNQAYWANRSLEPKKCRRCRKMVSEPKMRYHCKACRDIITAPTLKKKCETCDNILQRVTLRFCTDCKIVKRANATKRQTGARREHALAIKHGVVAKPSKDGTISSKFTTRGKIKYEGYRTL